MLSWKKLSVPENNIKYIYKRMEKNLLNSNNCRKIGGSFWALRWPLSAVEILWFLGRLLQLQQCESPEGLITFWPGSLVLCVKKKITKSLPRFLPIYVLPNVNKQFEGGVRETIFMLGLRNCYWVEVLRSRSTRFLRLMPHLLGPEKRQNNMFTLSALKASCNCAHWAVGKRKL